MLMSRVVVLRCNVLREYNIIYLSQIAMYWSITGTEKSVRRLFHPPHKLQCGREEGSG